MNDLPDDEAVLSRFRHWLGEARAEADWLGDDSSSPVAEGPEVGLYRLVEEFTALRQEVKLQTKSARGLHDEADALLTALRQSIEQFRSVAPKEEQAAQAAARPLAEALADLDEALDRGRAGLERGRQSLLVDPAEALLADLDALYERQSWLRRFWLRGYHDEARALASGEDAEARSALFDALLEGYGLIQSRLRRALDAEQIRRIDCVGRPVDPDRMTVIAVVDAPGVPPGEVVEELRRGYTWRGRVLRYAEVRAARSSAPDSWSPSFEEGES